MNDLFLIIGPIVVVALGLLGTPWGLPVLSWLVGNPVGRIVAIVGVSLAAVWIALQVGRKDGAARVKAQQSARNLEVLRDRIAVDEEVRRMPADARREELSKWVR